VLHPLFGLRRLRVLVERMLAVNVHLQATLRLTELPADVTKEPPHVRGGLGCLGGLGCGVGQVEALVDDILAPVSFVGL